MDSSDGPSMLISTCISHTRPEGRVDTFPIGWGLARGIPRVRYFAENTIGDRVQILDNLSKLWVVDTFVRMNLCRTAQHLRGLRKSFVSMLYPSRSIPMTNEFMRWKFARCITILSYKTYPEPKNEMHNRGEFRRGNEACDVFYLFQPLRLWKWMPNATTAPRQRGITMNATSIRRAGSQFTDTTISERWRLNAGQCRYIRMQLSSIIFAILRNMGTHQRDLRDSRSHKLTQKRT